MSGCNQRHCLAVEHINDWQCMLTQVLGGNSSSKHNLFMLWGQAIVEVGVGCSIRMEVYR